MATDITIKTFQDSNLPEDTLQQLEEIFFLTTTRKEFSSVEEKAQWFDKWMDFYISKQSQHLLLAFKDNELLGYLSGCDDTQKYWQQMLDSHKYYQVFEDLISEYPAHFHINCHPQAQGMGVGSQLVIHFLGLESIKKGVHILTGPQEQNVTFYLKNHFSFMQERAYNSHAILFMGRQL